MLFYLLLLSIDNLLQCKHFCFKLLCCLSLVRALMFKTCAYSLECLLAFLRLFRFIRVALIRQLLARCVLNIHWYSNMFWFFNNISKLLLLFIKYFLSLFKFLCKTLYHFLELWNCLLMFLTLLTRLVEWKWFS